jgi:transposase
VCESTGNYWIRLDDTLDDNGIDTVLANPIKTKIIAQAKLKDDKVDSNVLADLLRADLLPWIMLRKVTQAQSHLTFYLDWEQ